MEGREDMSSGVTVMGVDAPANFHVAARIENPTQVDGSTTVTTSQVSLALPGTAVKRKRGRSRKYGPDGTVSMALAPVPISSSAPPAGDFSARKRGRGRPADLANKQQQKLELENLGEWVAFSVGANFTPHVITVNAGEGLFQLFGVDNIMCIYNWLGFLSGSLWPVPGRLRIFAGGLLLRGSLQVDFGFEFFNLPINGMGCVAEYNKLIGSPLNQTRPSLFSTPIFNMGNYYEAVNMKILDFGTRKNQDVTMKVISFSQQRPRAICILSANGAISNVTLCQPDSSGGTLTYEGRFEILSLSGSFIPSESGGTRSRSGGMSVSLASPDGRVVGGGVAGLLVAASPVQVVVGSFLPSNQHEQKPKKQKSDSTSVVTSTTAFPISSAEMGGYSAQGQHSSATPKPNLASSSSFHGDDWASLNPMQDSRNSPTDINISLP